MAFAIDDWIIGYLFSKFSDKAINQFKTKKKFEIHLRGLIDQVEVEFAKSHPHKNSTGKYQFFSSQAFINDLLKLRFYAESELDMEQIKKKSRNDTAILAFSDELFDEYIALFEKRVSNDPELDKLEIAENWGTYINVIFEIHKTQKNHKEISEDTNNMVAELLKAKDKTVNNIRTINLPPAPKNLIGRTNKIKEIHRFLQRNHEVVLVNGLGGIGKTTVAQAYVNDENMTGGFALIAWVSVFTDIQSEFIELFATHLNIDLTNHNQKNHFSIIINHLANIPGEKLMIIDNANDLNDLNNNLQDLRSINWKIMITSRTNPDGVAKISVDELDPDDANDLFLIHYKTNPDKKEIDKINTLLGLIYYHTLFIEQLGKACNKGKISIENAIQRIKNTGFSNKHLQRKINTGEHAVMTNREKTTIIKDYMVSLFEPEKIPKTHQRVLKYFSAFPAEDIPLKMLKLLFHIKEDNEIDFENQLDELFQEGWLTGDGGFYKMHGLVQEVVQEKLKPKPDDYSILTEQLGIFLNNNNITNAEIFLPYAESLLKKLNGQNAKSIFLSGYLSESYIKIGNIDQGLKWAKKASESFNSIKDIENLAISYSKLGAIYQELGDFDKALGFFNEEVVLFKELYESNPKSESLKNGLANSYGILGDLYLKMGNIDEGVKNINKATELFKELYESNPKSESLKNGLAISYEKLGAIYQELGDFDKALGFFNEEVVLFKELYESNPKSESLKNGLAVSYYKIGGIYTLTGKEKEAKGLFKSALQLWEELYEETNIPRYKG
jgi:tetratricopeptide (TPR) repeat protein